ncbi:MAG TPA: ABC transporter permease [Bdellovibrionales bacterium]|nr:ABC transporter permease [Bdellovibrionales bacterium]
MNATLRLADDIGHRLMNMFSYTFSVLSMIYLSFRTVMFDQAQGFRAIFSVVSAQIYFTGWQALPLIGALALATGAVVIMQSTAQLSRLGGAGMLGELLVAVIVREIGPLITALIVIARSGTAVASELGNMKVNRETEALEAMGINPLSYIVFPRIVGGIVSVVCLAFYFVLIALLGGYLVSYFFHDLSFVFYTDTLAQALTPFDVWFFLLKNIFGGTFIFVVCCYQGLLVKESPSEVPQVTTKAVVNSIIYVVGFNLILSLLSYVEQLTRYGIL